MSPKIRHIMAWVLVAVSLIAWPITATTIARGEPQFVLGLSWFAITITGVDILATTDVRKTTEDGE